MKIKKFMSLCVGTIGFIPTLLLAQTSATAIVTFTISSISAISVSGNPAAFNISSVTPGDPPTSATDTSTTYAVTTNATGQKIQGSIDTAMPTGVTLAITLAAPSTGTSTGAVDMTTTPQNLVTGISNVAQSGIGITYTLSATAAAAPVASATRTVTYTIGP